MMHTQIENPFKKFWDLGYRNLLPVIPPGATMVSKRVAQAAGKIPGVFIEGKGWVGRSYEMFRAVESDLDTWFGWGASVGMRGDNTLFFVDLDHTDPKAAKRLGEIVRAHLGKSWPRVGQAPKLALPYRSTELVPSRAIKFKAEDGAGKQPGLDIISTAPYLVVHGIHAKTRTLYDWPEGIPAYEQLSFVTPEQVEAMLEAIEAEFPAASVALAAREFDGPAPDPETLRADPAVVKSAFRNMPNTHETFPDRADYIKMGYALRGAFGPDYEDADEVFELFQQWALRYDGKTPNTPENIEKDWNNMRYAPRVGAAHIFKKARDLTGWAKPDWLVEKEDREWHEHLDTIAPDFFQPEVGEGLPDLTPKAPAEGYRIESIADVMNRQMPKFLVADYLPQQGFGLLYGAPGCGKSFIALDMALHIAYGLDDWHGKAIKATSRKVLYIAGEGASGFKPRILAWQAANQDRIAGRTAEIGFLFQPVNFMRPDDIKKLVEAAKAMGDEWAFIVVDTVSRAIPGADENLQKDMTIFVHACDALRHAMSGFVLGVHHTSKAGAMRGSSVFSGQADAVFKLTRRQGAVLAVDMFCEKQKDAKDNWAEAFRLIETPADDAENASSLVPVKMKDDDPAAGPSVMDMGLQNMLLQAMDAAWKSGSPWSKNPRAKENFAPRVMSRDFGLRAEEATVLVDMWERTGLIVFETADRKSKRKGYKVVGFVTQAGSEDTDNTSETDGSDDVFE